MGRVIALRPPPPGRRRLSPRTLVTRLVTLSALRQYWGALLPLLAVLGVRGGFRSAGLVAIVAAVLLFALGGAFVEWWRTSYGVQDGRLVVERGLLRRALTVVPVDRIRGVDVHASALQRVLGIVSVRVDAAATGGGRRRGRAGRGVTRPRRPGCGTCCCARSGRPGGRARPVAPGAGTAAPPARVLARFERRWLLYAPLVGGYLLAPLAAFGALAN